MGEWTTDASKESWKSPDGKVTIWEVKSKTGKLEQTMSKAIAEHGWTGQIEAYVNDKGKRYIRQQKAAEGSNGSNNREDGMKAGNALNVAVAALQAKISKEDLLDYAQYVFDNFPKVEVNDEVTDKFKEMVEPLPEYNG